MAAQLQVVTSWSELDTARQCPHKHDLMFRQGWKPPTVGPALARGDGWHQVMEARYGSLLAGTSLAGAHAAGQVAIDIIGEGDSRYVLEEADVDTLRWMLDGYHELYGGDDEWEIVLVEQALQMELPRPSRAKKWPVVVLRGKLDLVVKWKGRLWLVDHKSGKDLLKREMIELADQFGLYTLLLRANGHKVFGQIHNGARTTRLKTKEQPLDERFKRTPMYRTDAELDRIARDAYMTAYRAWDANDQERHPDPDRCRWRCPYTEACLHGRKTTAEQEIDFLRSAGFYVDLSPRY